MSLSLTRLRRVAEMSDMDEFKKELKPFMKKRVSDTQGNREVQDVSRYFNNNVWGRSRGGINTRVLVILQMLFFLCLNESHKNTENLIKDSRKFSKSAPES